MSERPSALNRFEALDVLRGLAVLGMGLSGMLPDEGLPAWMYHAQLPPPTHEFTQFVYGITWVDLVFPFFLFSLGAAIPLALSGRVERGETAAKTVGVLLSRGFLLATFALLGEHLRPFVLSEHPDLRTWAITLLGFGAIALILIRWPATVLPAYRRGLTVLGWLLAAGVIAVWDYPDGTHGFANYRNDVILMIMANVAVSGGLIWLFTRRAPWLRGVAFFAVMAVYLTKELPGVGRLIWEWDPTQYLPIRSGPDKRFLPILYHFEYHKYLMIVVPGMVAGEWILDALKRGKVIDETWVAWQRGVATLLGPVVSALTCGLLLAREVTGLFGVLCVVLPIALYSLGKHRESNRSLPLRLFSLGVPLLLIGLLLEPLGGGIKKDTATLSYFWVTSGLGALMLGSLATAGEWVQRQGVWRALRDTGMNPIMGYVVITNLIWGVIGITGLHQWIGDHAAFSPILTLWAFVKTGFVAAITLWFTRQRKFLRA